MGRHINRAWFCVALQNALSGLANRANRVIAKNHVTPGHCALPNRVLSVRWTLISENAKSIPMLAAKARYRWDCILWNQSASRPGLQICLVSRKTRRCRRKRRRRRKRWYAAQSFRRYIVVGYSFNAAPNGLHTSYGQRKMTNILYSTRKNAHSSFFSTTLCTMSSWRRYGPYTILREKTYMNEKYDQDGSSCLIIFPVNLYNF